MLKYVLNVTHIPCNFHFTASMVLLYISNSSDTAVAIPAPFINNNPHCCEIFGSVCRSLLLVLKLAEIEYTR